MYKFSALMPYSGFQWRKFQDEIGEPPWDYYFLQNLDEKEYPRYLAKLFYLNTGERLPLRHGVIDKKKLKTFNQKIQWIKLYGVTPLMRDCTDKVKVRDYVKEKIGEEYLKPVLQIIPNNTSVIANHNSILGGEAIQRNLRKGETRVNEGIAYDSDSEVCDLPERQQIQRQEEVEKKTMNENSGIKSEFQNVDCHGTQNVVVPRLRFPKFQFRENRVFAEYNDGAPVFKDNDNKNYDVSAYFDQINFDKLPDSFVIKTNHGCKWQYIIKNKNEFLSNKRLFDIVKRNITGWLEQEYWCWNGFELQYKGIEPKILIELLMRNNIDKNLDGIQVYCFKGKIKYLIKILSNNQIAIWDENLNITNDIYGFEENKIILEADNLIKQTLKLSMDLSKDFNFVRVDWIIYQNKLYFEELTFTPYSGFNNIFNKKIGEFLQ